MILAPKNKFSHPTPRPLERLVLLCGALFAFVYNAPAGGPVAQVNLQPEVVATGTQLKLGEVAIINAPDAAIAERIRVIPLGYAPNIGAVRELTRERIALALAAAGFTAESAPLTGAPVVRVRRAAQIVSEETMRVALEESVLTPIRAAGAVAEFIRLELPPQIEMPTGAVSMKTLGSNGVRDWGAPFTLTLEIAVDSQTVRRLNVPVQVAVSRPVLVAARDIPANARLRSEDVQVEVRRLTRPLSNYLTDVSQLRGFIATRTLTPGVPVLTDAVASGYVIQPGDKVQVLYQAGKININIAGEARAAGRIGDRIQIKNLASGQLLQAVVIDEGAVTVRY
jgi:flagella basal body P-ring formation protein FlgA